MAHTCVHRHKGICTHTHRWADVHRPMHTQKSTIYICTYAQVHIDLCKRTCTHTSIYIHVYTCTRIMHAHTQSHIYTRTDGQVHTDLCAHTQLPSADSWVGRWSLRDIPVGLGSWAKPQVPKASRESQKGLSCFQLRDGSDVA